jgi:hypothetical protein
MRRRTSSICEATDSVRTEDVCRICSCKDYEKEKGGEGKVEEHREAQCLSKQEVGEESEDRRGLAEVWVYVPAELVSRIGRSLIRTCFVLGPLC